MSYVYFQSSGGDLICLDATSAVEVNKSNTVASYSMMDGRNRSDGYSEGNKIVNINGLVTHTKSVRQQQTGTPTPVQFQRLIESVERNHERFTLMVDSGVFPLLDNIKNCVISSRSVKVEQYLDTIEVNMTIEEVFVSKAATTTFLAPQPSPQASGQISGETPVGSGGTSTTKEEDRRTIALAIKEDGPKAVKNLLGFGEESGGN
ncbi:hypothetical protein [Vibrio phage JSF13]|uniref:Uncharacterized protein ORF78 n=1 Tax=Vibrio phage ICP1 TaxID=979525 RepID=F1D1A0_9CAUD|nr:endolysin [Vibrio phage ICP1]ADX88121.1 hypothetical protein TUST1-191_00375 [Vibrio phage ICP1_2006_D]ADX88348.1 hypothetical protein TUST1-182_00375 [Vibrio phage ICP1_2006_C]ADX89027.1 hypothetical protein TUST1-15_00375 [Vibrio phage ICP1_2005_A]ADX89259.1 hypothetical protein TUST1-2_00385 [Vibrio phage ICP1_2001_A]ADX89486.1 hypothetical protein TUST1-10_00370 [Vibrio phage ICP1_2004_A]APD17835.1 hypothetical protein [Vibrio phage JSF4]ASV41387.1 hypothetical protein [Vibrio phage J